MLVRVGRHFPTPAIAAAAQSVGEGGPSFYEVLGQFTVRVLEQVQHTAAQLEDEEGDADDDPEYVIDLLLTATLDLLEAWLLFASSSDAAPAFAPYAEGIFRAYVTARLALAGHDLHEHEDEEEEEGQRVKDRLQHHEELVAATHLARLAPAPSAAYLVHALGAARTRLEQGLAGDQLSALEAMEQLHWLTLIAGTRPSPPLPLILQATSCAISRKGASTWPSLSASSLPRRLRPPYAPLPSLAPSNPCRRRTPCWR